MGARGSIEPAVTGLSFLCRSCDPEPNPPSYSEDVVRATLDYLTRSFSGNARSLVAVLAKTPVSCCCCLWLCWPKYLWVVAVACGCAGQNTCELLLLLVAVLAKTPVSCCCCLWLCWPKHLWVVAVACGCAGQNTYELLLLLVAMLAKTPVSCCCCLWLCWPKHLWVVAVACGCAGQNTCELLLLLVAVLAKTPVSCCCCRCLCWLTPSHCDCNNNCKIFTLLGSALICTFMHLFFCSDVMSSCAWRILSHSLFLYVLSVVVFVIRERFAKKLNRA